MLGLSHYRDTRLLETGISLGLLSWQKGKAEAWCQQEWELVSQEGFHTLLRACQPPLRESGSQVAVAMTPLIL